MKFKWIKQPFKIVSLVTISSLITVPIAGFADSNGQSSGLVASRDHLTLTPAMKAQKNSTPQQFQTVKITNTSAHSIHVTRQASGGQGITLSGCHDTTLSASQACTIQVKTNHSAHGSGQIIVQGSDSSKLRIPYDIQSPYLVSDSNTVTAPDSGRSIPNLITITNQSRYPARFKQADIQLVGHPDGFKIASDYKNREMDSCFSSRYNHNGTIVLKGDHSDHNFCTIPVNISNKALEKGHALIKITGNFAQPQYIPIGIAPSLLKYSQNGVTLKGTAKQNIHLKRPYSFNVGNSFTMDKIKLNAFLSKFMSVSPRQIDHLNPRQDSKDISLQSTGDRSALDMLPAPAPQKSKNNIASNLDPLTVNIVSQKAQQNGYISLTVVSRQNLPLSQQSPGYIKMQLKPEGKVSDVNLKMIYGKGEFSTSGPLAGDSQQTCKHKLQNGQACTLWVKANPQQVTGFNTYTDDFGLSYKDSQGIEHYKDATLTINRRLAAGGFFQLPSSQDQAEKTPDVRSSSVMTWGGSQQPQWHWQQGGDVSFDMVGLSTVNAKGQLCVMGRSNGRYSFACSNGHQWLANEKGLPGHEAKFMAMYKVPDNQQAFGSKLAGGIIALDHRHHNMNELFYLPADANNAGDSKDKTQWQSIAIPKNLHINNFIINNGHLYAATKSDNRHATLYQLTVKGDSDHPKVTAKQLGQPIQIKTGLNRQYLLTIGQNAQGNTMLFVGGEQDGLATVYKNNLSQDGEKGWQTMPSLRTPGEVSFVHFSHNLNRLPGDFLSVGVITGGKTGQVYEYNFDDGQQWQKLGDTSNPPMSLLTPKGEETTYLGTSQLNMTFNSLTYKPKNGSAILSAQSHGQPIPSHWVKAGGLNTKAGAIMTMTPVNHIKLRNLSSD